MSRQAIIRNASAELGEMETPIGRHTKYGDWFGVHGQAWCAMFVSYIYDLSFHPLGTIDCKKGFTNCHNGYMHWKKTGELTKAPKMGDIVLYSFKKNGHCDHTGIFYKWWPGGNSFISIEGNTSSNFIAKKKKKGSERNGGYVMAKIRPLSFVQAFASPTSLRLSDPKELTGMFAQKTPFDAFDTAVPFKGDTSWATMSKDQLQLFKNTY